VRTEISKKPRGGLRYRYGTLKHRWYLTQVEKSTHLEGVKWEKGTRSQTYGKLKEVSRPIFRKIPTNIRGATKGGGEGEIESGKILACLGERVCGKNRGTPF